MPSENKLLTSFNKITKRLIDNGVPLLWIRDPFRKQPSVSLTLMVIAFVIYVGGLFFEAVKISEAKELLDSMAFLYFGRSLTGLIRGNDESKEKETQNEQDPKSP